MIWPQDISPDWLNDSKKLSENERYQAREMVEEVALNWAVARVDPSEIDEINILNASFLAMHRALDQLSLRPQCVLVDGNRFRSYRDLPFHCMIKGDGRYASIAAASILAKTYRDDYMKKLHEQFPQYGWKQNKGYPTAAHRAAIQQYGPTVHHRRSFRLLPEGIQGRLWD